MRPMQAHERDIVRPALVLAVAGGLLALTAWILQPFLAPLLWAAMIVVATWNVMLRLQRRLGRRRLPAALIMSVAQLAVFMVPLAAAIGALVQAAPQVTQWVASLQHVELGEPPEWLVGLPLLGERLAEAWRTAAEHGNVGQRLAPFAGKALGWLAARAGGFGSVLLHVLLTALLSALLYLRGEQAAALLRRFARRVSPEHGEDSVRLAGQAVRGVALGVVVTALVQSALGGLGLLVAGIPLPGLLTALMFLLAVAQVGAALVLAGAAAWCFATDAHGWGVALVVWTVLVGLLDNVLRPWLIKRGADLPLLLIFSGVVGGLVAFGLLGLFVGPMVLAVTWKVALAWAEERPAAGQDGARG